MAGKPCYKDSKVFTFGTSAGWKTLFMLKAPANLPLEVYIWGFKPRGQNNTDKHIRSRLAIVTNDGTGFTDVSATITVTNGRTEDPLATVLEGSNSGGFSTEPALATRHELRSATFHPQAPSDVPTFRPESLMVAGGSAVAIQVENDAGPAGITGEVEFAWVE
jgi:hypothetical protein